MFNRLGPDTGYDTIGDGLMAGPLARILDGLDVKDELPKTILYTLNPRDNDLIAAMTGCFQGGRHTRENPVRIRLVVQRPERGNAVPDNITVQYGPLKPLCGDAHRQPQFSFLSQA